MGSAILLLGILTLLHLSGRVNSLYQDSNKDVAKIKIKFGGFKIAPADPNNELAQVKAAFEAAKAYMETFIYKTIEMEFIAGQANKPGTGDRLIYKSRNGLVAKADDGATTHAKYEVKDENDNMRATTEIDGTPVCTKQLPVDKLPTSETTIFSYYANTVFGENSRGKAFLLEQSALDKWNSDKHFGVFVHILMVFIGINYEHNAFNADRKMILTTSESAFGGNNILVTRSSTDSDWKFNNFDKTSIMLLPRYYFGKVTCAVKPTNVGLMFKSDKYNLAKDVLAIFPQNQGSRETYGNFEGLSRQDIDQLATLFSVSVKEYPQDGGYCQNGGTFIGVRAKQSGEKVCFCPAGRTGANCGSFFCQATLQQPYSTDSDWKYDSKEIVIQANSFQRSCNDGNCVGANTCSCPSGKTGTYCEVATGSSGQCGGNCQNYGTCTVTDSSSKYSACKCIQSNIFTGKQCQYFHCNPECKNGGSCLSDLTCKCISGWAGATCEIYTGTTTSTSSPTTAPSGSGGATPAPTSGPGGVTPSPDQQCTRHPPHQFINQYSLYARITFRDLQWNANYANLGSVEVRQLTLYLDSALGPMYTISASLSFTDLIIVNVCASGTAVSVDYVATFTDTLSYKVKSKLILDTSTRRTLTTVLGSSTRTFTVAKAEYITTNFRLIDGTIVCGVYSTESACQNGGECAVQQGRPVCRCPGFWGTYCENRGIAPADIPSGCIIFTDSYCMQWWVLLLIVLGVLMVGGVVVFLLMRSGGNGRQGGRGGGGRRPQQPQYIIQQVPGGGNPMQQMPNQPPPYQPQQPMQSPYAQQQMMGKNYAYGNNNRY